MIRKHYNPPLERTYEIDEGKEQASSSCRRVLILEDDSGLAEILRAFFQDGRCEVTVVPSGREGVEKILKNDYDLVLCDMVMPGFPGDMFYRAVERVKPALCKRFIFMTGNKGDPKIDSFIRSIRGMILWKPFQLHELSEAIKSVQRKADQG